MTENSLYIMEPTWPKSCHPYRVLFKSPKFLARAHANGILCGLICKNSKCLPDGEPPTEDTNVIHIVMDQDGDLLYDHNEDGKYRYSKLLQNCLYEHQYDLRKGVATWMQMALLRDVKGASGHNTA